MHDISTSTWDDFLMQYFSACLHQACDNVVALCLVPPLPSAMVCKKCEKVCLTSQPLSKFSVEEYVLTFLDTVPRRNSPKSPHLTRSHRLRTAYVPARGKWERTSLERRVGSLYVTVLPTRFSIDSASAFSSCLAPS